LQAVSLPAETQEKPQRPQGQYQTNQNFNYGGPRRRIEVVKGDLYTLKMNCKGKRRVGKANK